MPYTPPITGCFCNKHYRHDGCAVRAGHFEAAGAAALKAVAAGVPEAPLEHAKLLWAMEKPHRAIVDMEQARLCSGLPCTWAVAA